MAINKKITMVNTANLTSKADFQRPINTSRVAKIVNEWDEKKMKPIQVADIDGTMFIWDGQHTAAAAMVRNRNKDLDLPCIVDKMTYQETCECVAQQDRFKAKHTALHQFNTSVQAGDIMDSYIMAVLEKYRIKVDSSCGKDKTSAIKTMRSIYKDSPLFLDDVLLIATKAWPGENERYRSDVMAALGKIVKHNHGKFKNDDMVCKVGVHSLRNYLTDAKRMTTGMTDSLVTLFLSNYNKGKKINKLSVGDTVTK